MVESKVTKELLVFWVRHGERADCVSNYEPEADVFNLDPYLTENGKQQCRLAGLNMIEHIIKQNFTGTPIKVMCSPYLRTLQSAVHL